MFFCSNGHYFCPIIFIFWHTTKTQIKNGQKNTLKKIVIGDSFNRVINYKNLMLNCTASKNGVSYIIVLMFVKVLLTL